MGIGEREKEEKEEVMLSGGGWCRRAEASSMSCPFVFVVCDVVH